MNCSESTRYFVYRFFPKNNDLIDVISNLACSEHPLLRNDIYRFIILRKEYISLGLLIPDDKNILPIDLEEVMGIRNIYKSNIVRYEVLEYHEMDYPDYKKPDLITDTEIIKFLAEDKWSFEDYIHPVGNHSYIGYIDFRNKIIGCSIENLTVFYRIFNGERFYGKKRPRKLFLSSERAKIFKNKSNR